MKWSRKGEIGTRYRRKFPDSAYHKIVTKKAKFFGQLMYCVLVSGGSPGWFRPYNLRNASLENIMDSLLPNNVEFSVKFKKPTRINCGINYGKGKDCVHRNVRLVITGKWKDKDFHKKVIKEVEQEYPGWMITGYALPKDEEY